MLEVSLLLILFGMGGDKRPGAVDAVSRGNSLVAVIGHAESKNPLRGSAERVFF